VVDSCLAPYRQPTDRLSLRAVLALVEDALRRLELIYGARQSLTLANAPGGGARVTIEVG
jgi:hypothetical protein